MEVQLAVACDCANIAEGGKLNIMGVFNTVLAQRFPTVHPFMALAIRLRLEFEDGDRDHELLITLRDEDGHELLRANRTLRVPRIPPGEVQHVDQVLNLAGMVFHRPGHFAFEIICDGQPKERVDLDIVQGTPPAS